MDTVLRSRSSTVTIGPDQPFCIIGERINPTGRKAFAGAAAGRRPVAGRARRRGAGGRRRPHARRQHRRAAGRRGRAAGRRRARSRRSLTDLPLCIDSSVVEALEAGLAAYEGKALVNSSPARTSGSSAILPLVKRARRRGDRPGERRDGIPSTADERLRSRRDRGHRPRAIRKSRSEDIVIDPLAMTVGADPQAVADHARDDRAASATSSALNMTLRRLQHVVRPAQPPRAQRRLPGHRQPRGPHQRDHGRAQRRVRDAVRAADLLLGRDEWGGAWIAHYRRQAQSQRRHEERPPSPSGGAAGDARRRTTAAAACTWRFAPTDGRRRACRPASTVFDAASWNGVAIDSTCGGHGTCKKCRVRIEDGEAPVTKLDARAFTPDELREGWRLACRVQAASDLAIARAAAADAAQGRDGRRRPPGDPAPGRAEALPGARGADARTTSAPTSSACSTRSTTSRRAPPCPCCARSGARCEPRTGASRRCWPTTR